MKPDSSHLQPSPLDRVGLPAGRSIFATLFLIGMLTLLPAVSHAQSSLTSGQAAYGSIGSPGGSNYWTFTATAGDTLIVRVGSLLLTGTNSLDPYIYLYGPNGARLATIGGYGFKAEEVTVRATNSGVFVAGVTAGGTPGDYRITFARTSVPNVTFSGGFLTNGWMHTGTIDTGSLGLWSFDAKAGDGIFIAMGNSQTNGALDPYLRLYDPGGTLVSSIGGYGYQAEDLELRAATNGSYLVVLTGGSGLFGRTNSSGSYRLTLAKTGDPVVTAPGDEGGPMTNGFMHTGNILLGDVDVWTFNAKAGDAILVRMGNLNTNVTLDPYLRLYGPDGKPASPVVGDYGLRAEEVTARATTNGTFTVLLSGGPFANGGVGQYRLTLVKTGDPIFTAPGDEGGPMTNGFMHTGMIDLGDVDVWSFNASVGDGIFLQMGNLMTNGTLDPYFRLYGPDGTLLGNVGGYGYLAEGIGVSNALSGTLLAVVSGGDAKFGFAGSTGAYRLTLAKTGAPIVTAPGDEGGPMTNGFMHTGFIDLGDADVWSVDAKAGDSIVVRMGDLFPTNAMDPYLRLYDPSGKLIQYAGGYGYIVEEFTTRATTNGTYMVVLSGGPGRVGGTGPYRITLAKNGDPIAVAPGDEGGELVNREYQMGSIPIGDLDVWSFYANAGTHPSVEVQELTDNNGFEPWVRLYGGDGRLLASQYGITDAFASITPTSNGVVTVVVSDAGAAGAHTGTYQIRLLCGCITNVDITGHVYCICNSNAIPGANIRIGTNTLTSDPSGAYSLSNVPPGTYTAIVSAPSEATLTTPLTVDGSQVVMTNDFYLTNTTFIVYPILDQSVTSFPGFPGPDALSNTIWSACQVYSRHIADPVCVRILFTSLTCSPSNPGCIADSAYIAAALSYSQYVADLNKNLKKSLFDVAALSTLDPPPDTGLLGNTMVKLTPALLDAIGEHQLADSIKQGGLSGYIRINFSVMNLSRSASDPSLYDLQTAALHEIDEVLGIGGDGSTLDPIHQQSPPTDGVGPLDLYRYEAPYRRSFSFSQTIAPYFSLNRGTNGLVYFNQYVGKDFGDWGDGVIPPDGHTNNPSLVQDAAHAVGTAPDLSINEMVALDVIGYTIIGNSKPQNIRYGSNGFSFSVQTVPGQTYQVQSTPDPSQDSWLNLALPFVATGTTANFTDITATASQQFYRVNTVSPTNAAPVPAEYQAPATPPEEPTVQPPATVRRFIRLGGQ